MAGEFAKIVEVFKGGFIWSVMRVLVVCLVAVGLGGCSLDEVIGEKDVDYFFMNDGIEAVESLSGVELSDQVVVDQEVNLRGIDYLILFESGLEVLESEKVRAYGLSMTEEALTQLERSEEFGLLQEKFRLRELYDLVKKDFAVGKFVELRLEIEKVRKELLSESL